MRVNRTFLYAGVFLLMLGGVVVIADLVDADTSIIADALRLWPLALVAIGVALVVRRSPAALPAGLVAAALPGLVLGGSIAAAPQIGHQCTGPGEVPVVASEQGTFAGAARVSIRSACGTLIIDTINGRGWSVEAGSVAGRTPTIRSSPDFLSIDADERHDWRWFGDDLSRLNVSLPTSRLDALATDVTFGEGVLDLSDADIGRLDLVANAGRLELDATSASIDELVAELSLGEMAILLPSGSDLTGTLSVSAGELSLCSPDDLGLRVITAGDAREVTAEGRRLDATTWTSPNYASAVHHADLTADVTLGALRINPTGGCR
ncbi:MAG TPA: hypothetical protein VFK54_04790 [Candidatus Limnocylindrales bacterium]|nr:hypothetical protein [Candidatus Limnocylindrales bacterium]